jgi:magnesium-transporting ATPase (P-type)
VLCLADRPAPSARSLSESHVTDLTFRGFVGLSDPARPTASAAIRRLDEAGIRTLMITGDHPNTAHRIGKDVGLVNGGGVLTGPEIEQMTDEELADALPSTSVIARVTPTQKGRIVRALQETGRTVGMAGDGANDAGAIRLAEVGMALGPDATEAARDAADVVVVDENIETMVRAVGEGRAMMESVRDAVAILAGGNFGEIGFSVAGSVIRSHPPLNARQLLLVNLMTDIAPSMAIALRRPETEHVDRLLQQDPTDLLRGQLDRAIAVRATATAGGAAAAWGTCRYLPGDRRGDSTVALMALVGTQLGQTMFVGHPTRETLVAGLGSGALLLGTVMVPGVSHMFGCRPVGPLGLGVAGLSSAVATGAAALAG